MKIINEGINIMNNWKIIGLIFGALSPVLITIGEAYMKQKDED